MQLIRVLLLAFACLISFNANAGLKVRFLNGIQNSEGFAHDNLHALMAEYKNYRKSTDPVVNEIDWDVYYNPEGSFLADNIELSIQGTLSGFAKSMASAEVSYQSIRAKWLGITLSDDTKSKLQEVKYRLYLQDYINLYLFGKGKDASVKISSTIKNTLDSLRKDLMDGSNVVIVSHSQGNLFAEEVYSQLTANEKSRVRFVGVASVASSTPNNRYVSLSGDGAVFGAYKDLLKLVSPLMADPLPSNTAGYYSGNIGIESLWSYLTNPICAARSVKCIEFSGHGFSTVYLNHDVQQSEKDLTTVASKIIAYVSESINELNVAVPSIANINASNTSPTTADAVTFTATASSDNGAITAWSWNFGDGTATSSEQSPTHTFSTAGTYTVTLTVTDAKGKQASSQTTITVSEGVSPGKNISIEVNYPSLGTVLTGRGTNPVVTTIGSGIEVVGMIDNPKFDVDISDTKIKLFNFRSYTNSPNNAQFSSASFNGLVIKIPDAASWKFTSANVSTGNTISGLSSSRISVSNQQISINLQGLSYNSSTVVELDYASTTNSTTPSFLVEAANAAGTPFIVPVGVSSCTFNATGEWSGASGGRGAGPEGAGPNTSLPGLLMHPGSAGALLIKQGGTYSHSGLSKTVTVSSGEVLQFIFNDYPTAFGDNSGSMSVTYSCK